MPLTQFRGNRFNILFYDSAGMYFLRSHFEKYSSEHHDGLLNRLLQAVLTDIRIPQYDWTILAKNGVIHSINS